VPRGLLRKAPDDGLVEVMLVSAASICLAYGKPGAIVAAHPGEADVASDN
jgi:hypothetical protein